MHQRAADPARRSVRVLSRKPGVRDEELAAIDVALMPGERRCLLKAVLLSHGHFELVLERFPNPHALEQPDSSARLAGFGE